jgi:hypothetical protein
MHTSIMFQVLITSNLSRKPLDNGLTTIIPTTTPVCDNDRTPTGSSVNASATTSRVRPILDIPDVQAHAKVENYLMQLVANTSTCASPSAELSDTRNSEEEALKSPAATTPLSPVQQLVSVSGGRPKGAGGGARQNSDCCAASDDGNVSVSSRVSRMSDLSNLTGRFSQGAFYGSMMGGGVGTAAAAGPVCPFPDEWQYNTIPEVIENDEEVD